MEAGSSSAVSPSPQGPADPGDAYESAKFGSGACSLMIAHAVWKFASAKRQAQLMR